MHADDLSWTFGHGGDAGDADAAGVGGEDAICGGVRIQVAEDLELQVHILRSGLHHQFGALHTGGHVGGGERETGLQRGRNAREHGAAALRGERGQGGHLLTKVGAGIAQRLGAEAGEVERDHAGCAGRK